MRFGKTLRNSVHPPWKDQYIDYTKLKNLLREDDEDDPTWTEDDENKFCDEVLNVQLEKVASFQEKTFRELERRSNKAGEKLKDLAPEEGKGKEKDKGKQKGEIATARFKEIEEELDSIINETKELKRYSNINYTGFLKIVKKHDRKRGNNYKIRPMVQMSLTKRPFNSDAVYSPLLNKLSMMYFVVRQQLDDSGDASSVPTAEGKEEQTLNGEKYTAHKFWIHDDNLLEVKTHILRRLPAIVYSDFSIRDQRQTQSDPTLNSLYFDNRDFKLYTKKVDRQVNASSLRVRWYGQLNTNPELVLEMKVIHDNGTSEEKRFPIKEKYLKPFIKGEYKMEKSIAKMERQGFPEAKVEDFKKTVADIQAFILDNKLEPMLRANYTRTAFQKPLDDKIRVSIDSALAFIREDALDPDRPCRDPNNWHRTDIDNSAMEYPFLNVNQGEISRFPYSILEIKVKDDAGKKEPRWVQDLMSTHLVHKSPRFSKFVHGVASLFEDYVNSLPFWISEVETDIRQDPQAAFDAEEARKAKQAENDLVVGSFLGTSKGSPSYKHAVSSPLGQSYLQDRLSREERSGTRADFNGAPRSDLRNGHGHNGDGEHEEHDDDDQGGYGTMASVFPSFSLSKYARLRRESSVQLPPGVIKPTNLIKDAGPLKVEVKVWLANERTFLKWQHICVLLGGLAVSLYSAAGKDLIAEVMGVAYILIALFAGAWGYWMHYTRRNMIMARSGNDFDNSVGPLVVSGALIVALLLNFAFQYHAAVERLKAPELVNATLMVAGDEWMKIDLV